MSDRDCGKYHERDMNAGEGLRVMGEEGGGHCGWGRGCSLEFTLHVCPPSPLCHGCLPCADGVAPTPVLMGGTSRKSESGRSSMSSLWELVKNAEPWAPTQNFSF